MECPRAFFYKYLLKINILTDSVHLIFGTAVHKAIETRDGNILHAQEVFEKEFSIDKISEAEKDKYIELIPIGYKIVEMFLQKREFLNGVYGISENGQKELWANATLENPLNGQKLNLPMKGRIDELTDKDQIIDYKTSKDFYDLKDEKFKFQTKLYALWFWATNHRLPRQIVYFVLPKNMKRLNSETPIQVIDLHFTVEELAEAWEQTRQLLIQIENRDFKVGKCMPWCDHRKLDKILIP